MSQPLLIKPPPAVKAVLEKTASFVAKNGRAFETRILNSDKGKTAKFAFLHATSPFHAYYEDRVRHYAEGGGAEEEDDGKKKTEGASGDGGGGKGDGVKDEGGKEGEKENAASDGRSDTSGKSTTTTATAAAVVQRRAKASVPDPVARTLLSQRNLISEQEKSRREALDALDKAKRGAAGGGGNNNNNNNNNNNSKGDGEVDIAKMEREIPAIQPPPPLTYTALTAPSHLTAGQIEIVKLTAQYAALSSLSSATSTGGGGGGGGSSKTNFIKILTEREWTNESVFGFLQPRNAAFAYFAALVDVYKLILGQAAGGGGAAAAGGDKKADTRSKGKKDNESGSTGTELLAELLSTAAATATANGNGDPTAAAAGALSVAAYRAEYDRHVEEGRLRQSDAADGGRGMGMGGGGGGTGRIDWHDFVVVETIDFAMDEVVDTVAPRPRALFEDDAANNNNNKKKADAGAGAGGDGGDRKPAAVEMEAEENAEVRFARAQAALAATAGDEEDDDDDDDDDDDNDEPIQIDATYQAKVVSTTDSKQTTAATHVVDPISGKSVPVEHLSEHMRIQLLDPNWSKQRKTFLDKQRESNIVGGDAIAANISGFAKEKGELFGSSEQELLDREASKQRLAEANKLIREQAQQQQQQQQQATTVAAVGASMPPPPPVQPAAAAAAPNHPRPSGLEAAPAAKRARVDAPPAPVGVGGGGAFPPPPPPPPPPPVQPAAAAPMAPVPAARAVPPPPPPHGGPMAPIAPPAPVGQTDTILAPEAFVASLSDPTNVEVTVQTPVDSTNASWSLDGRAVSVRIDVTTGTVKTIKEACRSELGGMPTNKMQLRMPGAGFLKDKDGLASLNIGPGTTLDLVPKKRGGR